MNIFITRIFFLTVVTFVCIQTSAQHNIVGKWVSSQDGDTGIFSFQKNGFLAITVEGETMGGELFDFEGMDACVTYTLKPTKKPNIFELDIYIRSASSDSSIFLTAPGLIEFIDKSSIKMAINFEHEEIGPLTSEQKTKLRPKDLSPASEAIIFKRIE
ncbi:MAG: hypothetical protein F9K23_16275 [Bacteroidetes bacterium]|nr:MAG: hypothetical protein F9K23_16275 [Bacteroidota bacterium]